MKERKAWEAKNRLSFAGEAQQEVKQGAQPAAKQEEKPVRIKASLLHALYLKNEVSADAYYKGRVMLINGVVITIAKDIFGKPYVVLEGIEGQHGVQCVFANSQASQLFDLSPGDGVLIEGKVGHFILGSVMVTDCTLRSAVDSSGKVKYRN